MEIDLKHYYKMIVKRFWIIVLCVLVFTVSAAYYSNLKYQPVYQATTKLIVNNTSQDDQMGRAQVDLGGNGVNSQQINTYKEIFKTPNIMEKVLQRHPDLNMTADQLISAVNITDINETQLIAITAIDFSYDRAVKIANYVSEVFQSEIPKIMKSGNITILNTAAMKDNPKPVNKKSNQMIVLALAASLVVSIGIILVLDSLDDTLKTPEDIQDIFDSPTLASIPKIKAKDLQASKSRISKKKVGDTTHAAINR